MTQKLKFWQSIICPEIHTRFILPSRLGHCSNTFSTPFFGCFSDLQNEVSYGMGVPTSKFLNLPLTTPILRVGNETPQIPLKVR